MGLFALVAYAFTTAASYLLRKRKKREVRVAPEPEEFQEPIVEEGGAIARLSGTAWLQKPMVLWQGDYATEPIVDAGETVGYRYFLGLHLGLCLGPVDRLIAVRFDQKSIPVAEFEPSSGLDLSVLVGVTRTTVHLPAGPYASGSAAAELFTNAIHAQTADTQTRIVYGYEIKAGWNDRWRVTFTKTGMGVPSLTVNFVVRPGWYGDGQLAAEINHQFDLACLAAGVSDQGGDLVLYDAFTTQHFKLLGGTRNSTNIIAAHTTGLEPIGFDNFADTVVGGIGASVEGIDTARDRFWFSVPSGTVIEWTHANTTCESLFGMTSAGPDFSSSSVCGAAVEGAIPQSTFEPIPGGIRVNLNAPELFGGDVGNNSEGGVTGIMDVYFGADDQPADDYLLAQAALADPSVTAVPAYRGICHTVMRRLNQGNSPYLKNPSFVFEKLPNNLGLTGDRHRIEIPGVTGYDINPACDLFDVFTNFKHALGIPESTEIDVEAFRRAGETLHAEGFGISYALDSSVNAREFVDEVMRHIDAEVFTDPETGLLTIALIRDDYDVSTLLTLGADDIVDLELTCADWADIRNVAKIRYTDRTADFAPSVLTLQDLASIQMFGRTDPEEISLSLITNPAVARIAGQRILKVIGYPLKRLRITATRRAASLRPVQPFIVNYPELGIEGLICRATRPRTGEIRNNRIVIEAAEDLYGIERAVFSAIE